MDNNAIIVLADPRDPTLAMLEALPPETPIAAGDNVEAFHRLAPEARVILSWSIAGELLEQVFQMTPRVKWVHARSAGLDDVLFPALAESPVILTNARGAFSGSLAEFVIGAVLFFAKGFRRMIRHQMAGRWEEFDTVEVAGRTMGIVGFGDIGRAVAARAEAMGMEVLAVRRRPQPGESTFPPERLREVLARCDYVAVTAPLTPRTRGLIGEPELRAMKPGAVIVNVGRGPVIAEAALVRALEQGWIRGAALDVFDQEPLPAGHPFYKLENVLLSPHCADHSPDWLERAMQLFLENFERFRKGEPLRNVVDKKAGY